MRRRSTRLAQSLHEFLLSDTEMTIALRTVSHQSNMAEQRKKLVMSLSSSSGLDARLRGGGAQRRCDHQRHRLLSIVKNALLHVCIALARFAATRPTKGNRQVEGEARGTPPPRACRCYRW
jgi:hypothetical protein